MPAVTLHAEPSEPPFDASILNPLPSLLQTPNGLALLEIQGTLHLPSPDQRQLDSDAAVGSGELPVGRLEFPLCDALDTNSTAWMKRVYFYVGKHQRLTGEVKKLPRPIAVIRKRASTPPDVDMEIADVSPQNANDAQQDVEIVDVVRFKILFASRPEPVGS